MKEVIELLIVTNIYPTMSSPNSGTFVRNAALGLESSGFNVNIISLDNESSKNKLTKLFSYFNFYVKTMHKIIFGQYGIIYVHYVSHSSIAVSIMRLLGKKFKYVVHVHGSDVLQESNVSSFKFSLKKVVSKLALKLADKIISPSTYYKDDVICPLYNIPLDKVFVSASGGVDLSVFTPSDIGSSLNTKTFTVGFASRLTEDKGVKDFIEIVKDVWLTHPRVKIVIVGDGPLKKEILDFSESNNVKYFDKVPQDELAGIFQSMDIFIFPTKRRTESLGLVGIEAMACGVPVVAYDMGGPRGYIKHGINGYLVNKDDVSMAASCVINYIESPSDDKARIISSAISTAREYCSQSVNKEFTELFVGLINE
jgi:glycosyltransferase involved in cell wall biosynthesis